jgi:dipeptidyl aminopeptidase/acylaminoacyl peptidase
MTAAATTTTGPETGGAAAPGARAPWTPDDLIYGFTPASDPQISPDGEQIAYTLTRTLKETGKVESDIYLMDRDGAQARRATYGGKKNSSPRWSPSGDTLAFVSDRDGDNGKKSTLCLLPRAGGEAQPLTSHLQPISSPAWSPDGVRIAYVTTVDPDNPNEEPRPEDAPPPVRVTTRYDYKQDNRGYIGDARMQVFVVDVASGERRQLTSERLDHQEPQWSPDGQTIAVRIPGENTLTSQLGLIDVESGAISRVGDEGGTVSVWSWSPNGQWIVYAGDERPTWQADIFRYEVATGALSRLTEDLPVQPDAGSPTGAPPAQPIWLDERTILISAVRAGASGLYTFDLETADLAPVVGWQETHSGFSTDRANRFIVQSVASIERNGEIALYDRATGEYRILTSFNYALLATHGIGRWERFDIERGGFTIEAWLLFPPDFDATKKYPVILDIHGGPNGHYGYSFNNNQQLLASNGYLVVYSNPRGSSTYGRQFTQQVIRDWGGEDYLDLMAVVDKVLERPYADASRTGVYGYSYGGYMTSWIIGHTDRFAAAVCGAPCFDLVSMYGTSDIGPFFGEAQWGGGPHDEGDWLRAHSP